MAVGYCDCTHTAFFLVTLLSFSHIYLFLYGCFTASVFFCDILKRQVDMMKKCTWIISIIILFLCSCKPVQYVPIKEETVIVYKDSTIYHQDTIHIQLATEVYNTYTSLMDTLYLETQYSNAIAYIDTANKLLNGSISNKHISLPVVIEYKDRIIRNDTTIYVDKPVYVEVENKSDKAKAEIWKILCFLSLGAAIIILISKWIRI